MHPTPRAALLFVVSCLLGACMGPDRFARQEREVTCERVTACESEILGYYAGLGLDADAAANSYAITLEHWCDPETEPDPLPPDCDFDRDAAHTCLNGIESSACAPAPTGFVSPEACAALCPS